VWPQGRRVEGSQVLVKIGSGSNGDRGWVRN
jgi:hypothetical protein